MSLITIDVWKRPCREIGTLKRAHICLPRCLRNFLVSFSYDANTITAEATYGRS